MNQWSSEPSLLCIRLFLLNSNPRPWRLSHAMLSHPQLTPAPPRAAQASGARRACPFAPPSAASSSARPSPTPSACRAHHPGGRTAPRPARSSGRCAATAASPPGGPPPPPSAGCTRPRCAPCPRGWWGTTLCRRPPRPTASPPSIARRALPPLRLRAAPCGALRAARRPAEGRRWSRRAVARQEAAAPCLVTALLRCSSGDLILVPAAVWLLANSCLDIVMNVSRWTQAAWVALPGWRQGGLS